MRCHVIKTIKVCKQIKFDNNCGKIKRKGQLTAIYTPSINPNLILNNLDFKGSVLLSLFLPKNIACGYTLEASPRDHGQSIYYMGLDVRKPVFGGLRTTKAQ